MKEGLLQAYLRERCCFLADFEHSSGRTTNWPMGSNVLKPPIDMIAIGHQLMTSSCTEFENSVRLQVNSYRTKEQIRKETNDIGTNSVGC